VPLRRFDDLLDWRPLPGQVVVKLDVEGNELAFLQGAQEFLSTRRPILLMEINPGTIAASGTTGEALKARLIELGYDQYWDLSRSEQADTLLPLADLSTDRHRNIVVFPLGATSPHDPKAAELGRSPARARILILSTPVGPLGSGVGGGVEMTLRNLVQCLTVRGYGVEVIAPAGSVALGDRLYEVAGTCQPPAQNIAELAPDIHLPADGVLAHMWQQAQQLQHKYDVLVNFAYDWLPLYLTPFFDRPIAHWISMSCLSPLMDQMVSDTAIAFPGTVAVNTAASAKTFRAGDRLLALGKGIDLSLSTFVPQATTPSLAWVGRISPEKGLADAVAAAAALNIPLKIAGVIQDEAYWQGIRQQYPHAPLEYLGFLSTADLQGVLGPCRGLLMTPHWEEAFGNVTIEALACGVPVIAYRRGGLKDIITDGKTGYLVDPGDVSGLMHAITQLDALDRHHCRTWVEAHHSLESWGDRMEAWLLHVMDSSQR
jgi:UDP-glucose:tetrahydrobiopterin glucosyltransferase